MSVGEVDPLTPRLRSNVVSMPHQCLRVRPPILDLLKRRTHSLEKTEVYSYKPCAGVRLSPFHTIGVSYLPRASLFTERATNGPPPNNK